MEAREALLRFLGAALGKKRERIREFASKRKTEAKFLTLLSHELGRYFSQSAVVAELPPAAWEAPAYAFVAPHRFGDPHATLRDAFDLYGDGEGALLLSADGRYGIWCDHTYADERLFLSVETAG